MNNIIDILLAFNEASRIQAEEISRMLMEAFNSGNVTDAQFEDVSSLLERHLQWCAKNNEIVTMMTTRLSYPMDFEN